MQPKPFVPPPQFCGCDNIKCKLETETVSEDDMLLIAQIKHTLTVKGCEAKPPLDSKIAENREDYIIWKDN